MLAPTLALMNRTLREDIRALKSTLFRIGFLAFSFSAVLSIERSSRLFGAPGLEFFQWLFGYGLLLILILGVLYFSNVITEEKEQMTLGLLRMAGVGPLSVLLGKSTAQLLAALMLLTLQFPFMLLAITLGGVTLEQVLAAYCCLLAFTVFMANLGLLCSVVCKRASGASRMTGFVVLTAWLSPVVVLELINEFNRSGLLAVNGTVSQTLKAVFETLRACSPTTSFALICQTGFAGPVISLQVVSNVLLGAVFFLLAWSSFELFTRDATPAGPARGIPLRRKRLLWILAPGRAWRHALIWKDFYFLAGGWQVMLATFVLYGLLIGGAYYLTNWRSSGLDFEHLGGCALVCMTIVILLTGFFFAARLFQTEIEWKTLNSLLILPLPLGGLAYSKAAGCVIGLVPAGTYFLAGMVLCPEAIEDAIVEPAAWGLLVDYVCFLYLVVYLSTFGKWGAPAAIVIMFALHSCCIMGPMARQEEQTFIFFGFVGQIAILALHVLIAERLRRGAGE